MAESLSGTVKLPVVGPVPKKELAIGAAVVGVLAVVYYVRKRQSGTAATAAAGAATSSDQYPPDGTTGNPQDPYSTDPATGQTYGDESVGSGGTFGAFGTGGINDTSSSAYPWDGSYGNPSDPYSQDPATGLTYGDEGYVGGTSSDTGLNGPPFSTNTQWSNYVLQQQQSNGGSISGWEDALGLYLNGEPVSSAQKTIVFEAQALGGPPPVAGANNYPPNVRTNGGKGGGGPHTTLTVPDVKGQRRETAEAVLKQQGFTRVVTDPANPPHVPQGYKVASQTPAPGTRKDPATTITLHVQAYPAPKKTARH